MTMFAIFDVETTGLYPDRGDRIVEIAAAILDDQFRVVRLFDSLVNPGRTIPPPATAVHRISNADVSRAPSFSELLPDLDECFEGVTHLVGHNVPFDLAFLTIAFGKSGEQLPDGLHTVCTLQLAKRYGIGNEDNRYKLQMVAAALEVPLISEAHQAMFDVGVTAKIFSMLYEKPSGDNACTASWPVYKTQGKTSRQLPRESISVSCERLARLGLSLSTNLNKNFPDLGTFGNATGNKQFDDPCKIGLSSAAVAELKAKVRLPEATSFAIQRPHDEMNDTSSLTWYLFTQQKKDIASIARERSLTESTVHTHLEQALRYGLIGISCIATPVQIQRIADARGSLPVNDGKLKPLFEVLNGEFSYGLLKCVITWLDRGENPR